MAYEKLNLADGQVFTAAHVAHIESGIAEAEAFVSPKLTINVHADADSNGTHTSDKTFEEIQSAIIAGQEVCVVLTQGENTGNVYMPLIVYMQDTQIAFSIYMGSQVSVVFMPDTDVQVSYG